MNISALSVITGSVRQMNNYSGDIQSAVGANTLLFRTMLDNMNFFLSPEAIGKAASQVFMQDMVVGLLAEEAVRLQEGYGALMMNTKEGYIHE